MTELRRRLAVGGGAWVVVAWFFLWLRSGWQGFRAGDLKILYYLAGSTAVDRFLVGKGYALLVVLHSAVAFVLGAAVTALASKLLFRHPRGGLWVGLASGTLALAFESLFLVPV